MKNSAVVPNFDGFEREREREREREIKFTFIRYSSMCNLSMIYKVTLHLLPELLFEFHIYPPTERFRGYTDKSGVRLSVRSCPLYTFKTLWNILNDTLHLCRIDNDNVSRTQMGELALILFDLFPL